MHNALEIGLKSRNIELELKKIVFSLYIFFV